MKYLKTTSGMSVNFFNSFLTNFNSFHRRFSVLQVFYCKQTRQTQPHLHLLNCKVKTKIVTKIQDALELEVKM